MITAGFLQDFLYRQQAMDDIQCVKGLPVAADAVGFALTAGAFDSGGSIFDIGILHFLRPRRFVDIQNAAGVGNLMSFQTEINGCDGFQQFQGTAAVGKRVKDFQRNPASVIVNSD